MTSVREVVPMWLRHRVMDIRGRGPYSGYPNRFKCIFIHIPKAAGTSVAMTLFGEPSRHVPYFEYERANAWKFKRYFKFAFVRNPWDRLVSAYTFLKKGGLNEQDRKWADFELSRFDDFESFVENWLTPENAKKWVHFLPQHYWVCNPHSQVMVDFVGRFENIDHDFQLVAARFGCSRSLSVINSSERRHYSFYYSPKMRQKVGAVYKEDIEIFQYRFEERSSC